MTTKQFTVHFYCNGGREIARTRSYADRKSAERAMARARARGQISMYAGVRTTRDQPTAHH